MNTTARASTLAGLATVAALAAVLLCRSPADAVATRRFVLDDAASLAAGELDGTAVHSDGSVTAAAELRRVALDEVQVAFTFARGSGGDVFIGTGNDGKVLRLRGDALSVFAETGQLLVSALAAGEGGVLYAGTLPEGRIYRIEGSGAATELAKPDGADHVWDLVWDARRRTLFAATGPEGKVYAIDAAGRAEVYWDSDAAHVMCLALAADGSLYAGTDDDAIVARLRAPGRAEVVHDFPGNEITSIAERDGVLAVAANELPDAPVAAPTPAPAAGLAAAVKRPSTPPSRRTGKGRLWRVGADGRAERVYTNDDGHFTDVQIDADGAVWVASSSEGRVYRVAADRTSATFIDVDERQVTAIDLVGDVPMLLASDSAALYRIVSDRPRDAVWTSKVLDADFAARFGQLTWRATGSLQLETRTGNREEPDGTWSAWSSAMSTPGPIRSPAGRFLQIRARFPAAGGTVLRAVTAHYLPQNQRAVVRDVRLKVGESSSSKSKAKASRRDRPPAPATRYELTWGVDNEDEDELRFRLRYRGEGQTRFRDMLRESEPLTATEYTWETNGIPDGWYVVQVEASDEPSNPPATTLRPVALSEPLLIDNHPPRIEQLRADGTRVAGRAIDAMGPIARLEHAVDGHEWRDLYPADDLLDTADERFEVDVGPLESGEHVVAVRATDAGGNPVTAEVTIRVP